ncbi:PREDICTED: RNA pseudouridine synthase 4, mitochondrial [Tarenaya hassleriana]|uniref:RNA pseudouridine synthase 4, mitochondrial n=1 Tax=Tarenaya hassleriana TaxID=28532 RepID=UPI00053C3B47|nr:PREDICTED: RNA pseudouridine synthase 4, mitochondrial [Tarenaya hassleriana]
MAKLGTATLRRLLRSRPPTIIPAVVPTGALSCSHRQYHCSSAASDDETGGKWLTLPPFSPSVDGAAAGKEFASGGDPVKRVLDGKTTALKWILRCCPDLPRNLVQKLFRLRQVRRESAVSEISSGGDQSRKNYLRRVAAKEPLNIGDRIYLPITVRNAPEKKESYDCSEEERKFIQGLVLYKDSAIIVMNKPHGLAVQGGIGIKTSLDELAATCLTLDGSESPRLVHRLDRDCSGLLLLARTQTSAALLHSVFREKTSSVSVYGVGKNRRTLKRKYWALVIGRPRRPRGLISAPLRKVVVDDGKSDRITVHGDGELMSSQHAITEFRVLESSSHGYSWLELCPLTGRKHQLRVHCAEVLGTPILGDLKYGWQSHRTRKHLSSSPESSEKTAAKMFPFGLNLEGGDISSKQPHLHLHSKEIVLPDISELLEKLEVCSDYDPSGLKSLKFDAPLPTHMQISRDILKSQGAM